MESTLRGGEYTGGGEYTEGVESTLRGGEYTLCEVECVMLSVCCRVCDVECVISSV